MQTVVAALCGILFGAGLAVSGMTNPARVLGFLDVFGRWDPTLGFVIAGAVAVAAAGFAVARRRDHAWLGGPFRIPTRRDLDAPLVAGAVLFGAGWGLVGLCPGPALANLGRGSSEVAWFVGAMLAGIALQRTGSRIFRRAAPDLAATRPNRA